MTPEDADALWPLIHAERAALAEDLADTTEQQWHRSSLCGAWSIEEVLAHLTQAASLGRWQWLRSIAAAGFRPAVHNDRQIAAHRGATPQQTLQRFRVVLGATTAPSGHLPAYLGEAVVHAQDIRHPLGITRTPSVAALTPVADIFATHDFTVPSRRRAKGLRLEADDGPFASGAGPVVTGPTLALVMTMAGRSAYADQLDGPGAVTLRSRLTRADRR